MLLLLSCWSPLLFADSTSYALSEIAGVQLWLLGEDDDERFLRHENEFVAHCDGSRSIYVGSMKAQCASPNRWATVNSGFA